MYPTTDCCLITFCFPLWNYWKETIASHNHLQYCMCTAEYWIDIMSIEFGSTSAVIFWCIFHCQLKRKWKEGGKWLKFPGFCEMPLYFHIFLFILCFVFSFNNNNRILPFCIVHICQKGHPVKYGVWSLLWNEWAYQTFIYVWKKLKHRMLMTYGD